MIRLDFDKITPDFTNDEFNWYIAKDLSEYITCKQADNLPSLSNLMCFVVKGIDIKNNDVEDYVLINHKQQVVRAYSYTPNGFEQMQAFINILKVSQHYDEKERN